jgi:hypothetical protein
MPLRLKASERAAKLKHFRSPMELFTWYRKSAVPEGGWTHENFVGDARRKLVLDVIYANRAARLAGMRALTRKLEDLIKEQIENILLSVVSSYSRLFNVSVRAAAEVAEEEEEEEESLPLWLLLLPAYRNNAEMWNLAIEAEFSRSNLPLLTIVTPTIQSVAGNVFSKSNALLGVKPTARQAADLQKRTSALAKKVVVINQTTQRRLSDIISDSINNGDAVAETVSKVRAKIPSIATNRVPTIVRTEMGRAADEAMKHSMKISGTVSHFDVIGCEKIEPGIPTLNGIPTCNITGVPIRYESSIEFHINHTGVIVYGAFRKEDGSEPVITMRNQGVVDASGSEG